jgi:hypothetical protein
MTNRSSSRCLVDASRTSQGLFGKDCFALGTRWPTLGVCKSGRSPAPRRERANRKGDSASTEPKRRMVALELYDASYGRLALESRKVRYAN